MRSLLSDEKFFTSEIFRGGTSARAGAACECDIEESGIHHCMTTSCLFGRVDMARWL